MRLICQRLQSPHKEVGNMDYIRTLHIMKDDLDAETTETALASTITTAVAESLFGEVDPGLSGSVPLVE